MNDPMLDELVAMPEPAYPNCYEIPRTGGCTSHGYSYEQMEQYAAAAIAAERNARAWQPIATAPRDGTMVDLWNVNGYRVTDVEWVKRTRGWFASSLGGYCGENQFTHWMPVPAPPE